MFMWLMFEVDRKFWIVCFIFMVSVLSEGLSSWLWYLLGNVFLCFFILVLSRLSENRCEMFCVSWLFELDIGWLYNFF